MKNMLKQLFLTGACLLALCVAAPAQQTFPLYPEGIPNAIATPDGEQRRSDAQVGTVLSNVSRPTLTAYLPPAAKRNGTAVIVCPGGGYGVLCISMEGEKIAQAFNREGITAFVLKYRLPSDATMKDRSIGPLQDAQQAIREVRRQAAKWSIDPGKIGIMGFSAGGHLASTAGTHFNGAVIDNPGGISLRPDFMILVYPVISFSDSIGHRGSRNNLLGETPSAAQVQQYSNELQVTGSTPSAFLVHAEDDKVVPVSNSIQFYEALRRHHVPASLHIYEKGDHGFLKQPPFSEWFGRCLYWLQERGLAAGK